MAVSSLVACFRLKDTKESSEQDEMNGHIAIAPGDLQLKGDATWRAIRTEAEALLKEENSGLDSAAASILPAFVRHSIIQHKSLEDALAAHLALKLKTDVISAEGWQSLLVRVFREGKTAGGAPLSTAIRKDLEVIGERDPACPGLAHAMLHFKGFQGLQLHRAAAVLWREGKCSLASLMQSRMSEVFAMDIHPGASIGVGVLIDHATGVVIGETAVVGDGCSFLHGVTLGGTGKEIGDRHPKLGKNVFVGAGASILGNVCIGEGSKIGAAALVLTDIPPHVTAVGCPAKVIGQVMEDNPAAKLDASCRLVKAFRLERSFSCPYRHLRSQSSGFVAFSDFLHQLEEQKLTLSPLASYSLFSEMDQDKDGHLSMAELEEAIKKAKALCSIEEIPTVENWAI